MQIEKVLKEKDEALNRCIEARKVSIELSKEIELSKQEIKNQGSIQRWLVLRYLLWNT